MCFLRIDSKDEFSAWNMYDDEWQPLVTYENGSKLPEFSDEVIEEMKSDIKRAKQDADMIIQYNDYLVTAMHPKPPCDRNHFHREESTVFKQTEENKHPSGRNPFETLPQEEMKENYCKLLNAVQRHCHGKYCNKKYKRPNPKGDPFENAGILNRNRNL